MCAESGVGYRGDGGVLMRRFLVGLYFEEEGRGCGLLEGLSEGMELWPLD